MSYNSKGRCWSPQIACQAAGWGAPPKQGVEQWGLYGWDQGQALGFYPRQQAWWCCSQGSETSQGAVVCSLSSSRDRVSARGWRGHVPVTA